MRLLGRSAVQYVRKGKLVHEVALPATEGWVHLGWRIAADHREIRLRVNGIAVDEWESKSEIFELVEGDFVVGQAGEVAWGFRGWIDDLVVLAHDVDPEVACNHAGGTLVRVADGQQGAEAPAWAHDAIAAAAGDTAGKRYACSTAWRDEGSADSSDAVSVRDAIVFPEGPLRVGAPRPDASTNPFCLSCHSAEGQGGLGLDALVARPDVMAEDDPRRQPSQPPRRVFGNIPAGWIPPGQGPGSPLEATIAPDEGLLIDWWVLPNAQ